MNRFAQHRRAVAIALAIVIALGIVPAYGASAPATVPEGQLVPNHALVGGVDLYSLDATAARAVIASASVVPSLAPITAQGDGHKMTFKPVNAVASKSAVYVNVEAMLEQAYEPTTTTTPFALTPLYSIRTSVVSSWTNSLARKIDHKAKDAKRSRKGYKLVVSKEAVGHAVNKPVTTARLKAAVASEVASPDTTLAVVAVALKTLKPKVTRKNIGKAILVVLSQYKIRLYNGTKIEKTYRCAIGMRAFPTPTGKWKVIRKVKYPSWHNPGSGWAKNMPSVIGPGPSNPLGTRAIYLNASGIRFHGTYKWWSIGRAASHGCMRMRRADVEDFYPRVPVGTAVWIVR